VTKRQFIPVLSHAKPIERTECILSKNESYEKV
jgi:hypothetical protein